MFIKGHLSLMNVAYKDIKLHLNIWISFQYLTFLNSYFVTIAHDMVKTWLVAINNYVVSLFPPRRLNMEASKPGTCLACTQS